MDFRIDTTAAVAAIQKFTAEHPEQAEWMLDKLESSSDWLKAEIVEDESGETYVMVYADLTCLNDEYTNTMTPERVLERITAIRLLGADDVGRHIAAYRLSWDVVTAIASGECIEQSQCCRMLVDYAVLCGSLP